MTLRSRLFGLAAVAVIAAVTLARFEPEATRIDREVRHALGRLAVAALVAALAAAALHVWRRGPAGVVPALPLLLAAAPGVVGHTKWVLGLSLAVLLLVAGLELLPTARGLDAEQRWIALATLLACFVFAASWTQLHQHWYAPFQIIDTQIYEGYGDQVVSGKVPYRDFSLEYPPGAIAAFVAPELTARRGDFGSYGHSFEKWAAGWGIAMVVLIGVGLAALRTPPVEATAALGLAALSPVLLGNVMLSRFDLLPAALTAAALVALLLRRDALAAVVLGVAVAVKLYPAVLVPLGAVWVWRRRDGDAAVRWLAPAVGVAAAFFLPFAILGPGGLAHSFSTQLGRPLQLESLGSALLIAAHHVAGVSLVLRSDHGSQNLESGAADWIGAISSALQICAIAWVAVAFARGPATRERLVVASAAAVAAFIAFAKVFSPQYMIWLIPLVALVRGLTARLLLAAGLVLTLLWFPNHYWALALEFRPRESWLLLARDLTVVALLALLVRSLSLQDERLGEDDSVREPAEPVRGQVEVGSS